MNRPLLFFTYGILLSLGRPATAHRLDEYLQATVISVETGRVEAQMRLTPGVAVSPIVLAGIDTNADGVLSGTEQQAYAEQVLRDLSLTVDGDRLSLQLLSVNFPAPADMKDGIGAIQIQFGANLPRGHGNRRLAFDNHHLSAIAAYMVNCLVPRDPNTRVVAQQRNEQQSFYQLDYTQE